MVNQPPRFLCDIFKAEHGEPRQVLRRKFEELEAYSSTLPGLSHSTLQAYTSAPLSCKNRYRLILPLSEARVRLSPMASADSDYINANYVGTQGRKYIATQAPLPKSFSDFWRMVWGEQVQLVLMLVKVQARKADCYWPSEVGRSITFDDCQLAVELMGEECVGDGLTKRVFKVESADGCTRLVNQFHYEHWPDHGPPCSFQDFFNLHLAITSDASFFKSLSLHPIVVHCSAGVGRTGTFITIDSVVDALKRTDSDDDDDIIMKMIKESRRHRPWFVETEEQFIFIYEYVWWWWLTAMDKVER